MDSRTREAGRQQRRPLSYGSNLTRARAAGGDESATRLRQAVERKEKEKEEKNRNER